MKNRNIKNSLLVLAGFVASMVPAAAILDANNNGLSDVWERKFNQGNLFSTSLPGHLPTADPDGDGWNNQREAEAGSDPFNALPPEGCVKVLVTRHPLAPGLFVVS